MRIVVTNPYCWPYVRRGAERHIEDLSTYLTSCGHQVVLISSRPRGAEENRSSFCERTTSFTNSESDGPIRIVTRQHWVPSLLRKRVTPLQTFFLTCMSHLPSQNADIVHCMYFSDGLAANFTRKRSKHRVLLQLNGPPILWAFSRWLPPDRWAMKQAARGADQVIAISQFVAQVAEEELGVRPVLWPVPICIDHFPLGAGPADDRPSFLSVADFNSRRKGVRVLVQAFEQLVREIPEARLRLSGSLSDELRNELLQPLNADARSAIEILGVGKLGDLPALYQSSSVLVLPAMWEAAGMVMFEAWASGTPVVATRHGGLPEFVTPDTGVLFDPESNGEETQNVEGLLAAMRQGLELSRRPEVRQRCREHARAYSWESLGPRLEALYHGEA